MIQSIEELEIEDKRVFIRADLDVPISPEGEIEDDSKIKRALKTINYALSKKAKVILASNFGSPKGKYNKKYTLEPVGAYLSELLKCRIYFPENSVGDSVKKVISDMMPGELMLLENLDFHSQETQNGEEYARKLSKNLDIYVNEAFSLSNQNRSSILTLPGLSDTAAIGFDFKRELRGLEILKSRERPLYLILGGLKADRKIEFMASMIDRVDGILTGGAVASTFLNAKGIGTGVSEIDRSCFYRAKKLLAGADIRKIEFLLPSDVMAAEGNLRNHGNSYIISGQTIPESSKIMDIGSQTVREFKAKIGLAKTVLWNGPLGVYEKPEFVKGSSAIVDALLEADCFTAALGAHTVRLLNDLGIEETVEEGTPGINFISYGEEASLEFIENGTLPSVEALDREVEPLLSGEEVGVEEIE